jgi:RHS repeat-associated protein
MYAKTNQREPLITELKRGVRVLGGGSVVALSNSNGDSYQSYKYSVYGQVTAEDPNFLANPYMFTGRRFDIETGLYYYRARYYNPHIGRFMQTDPVGYSAGMTNPNRFSYRHFVSPIRLRSGQALLLEMTPSSHLGLCSYFRIFMPL